MVPCSFKERLVPSMTVGPHGNWIAAKCGNGVKYYINLQILFHLGWLHLLGPQWVGLCEAYLIKVSDILKFTYAAADHLFHVQVRDTDNHITF